MQKQAISAENLQPLEDVFQIIQDYHQLELSYLLKAILREKQVSISELFTKLESKRYYLSLESLYRYFSENQKNSRFPPQEFILIYAEVLKLTDEQKQLLCQFWKYFKLIKKGSCCH